MRRFATLRRELLRGVGIENAEFIFPNDFRWSAQLIPWHDLLLMSGRRTGPFTCPEDAL